MLDIVILMYFSKDNLLTKETIRNTLNITNKTLNNDIDRINEIVGYDLIVPLANTIELAYNSDLSTGVKPIYRSILKNSPLVSYFYETTMNIYSLDEIYDNLFLSESMEYRSRQYWNNYFKNNNYKIEYIYNADLKKVQLIGDEEIIRPLMRYMLYEYCYDELYDDSRYRRLIKALIQVNVSEKLNLSHTQIDLFCAALYVSLIRISQGFSTKKSNVFIARKLFKMLKKHKIVLDTINNDFELELTAHLIGDIFGNKSLETIKLLNHKKPTYRSKKKIKRINGLLSEYSKYKYGEALPILFNESNYLLGILNFADTKISHFLYDPPRYYWQVLAKQEDKQRFEQLLHDFHLRKQFPNLEKIQEFYFYMNNILEFTYLENMAKIKKILIISRYPAHYQCKFQIFLNNRYQQFIQTTIYDQSIAELTLVDIEKYDYIFSELTNPLFEGKKIYFPEILSKKYIQKVDDCLLHY